MTLFLSTTLGISIVSLIFILTLKRIEMRTGRVLFRGLRPLTGRVLGGSVAFVEYVIPHALRRGAAGVVHLVQNIVRFTILHGALLFERTLEVLLHRVREKTRPPKGNGEASEFLQEVAEHKRALLQQPESKRTIFDD
ncbi:hypothetical protein H7X87_03115 [Acetobacteraceae bacterium]|nr:hypothetical protein [Candidatus Parcubacteria bacterium]